jgi:hypothetical protein
LLVVVALFTFDFIKNSNLDKASDFRKRPVMVQMGNDTIVVRQLPLEAQHWIQDRRNHYWLDHGVGYHYQIPKLKEGCELMEKWQEEHSPSCNNFHEIDMTEFSQKDTAEAQAPERQVMRYIATGGFRTAWMVSEYDGTSRVLKTLRYVKKRAFDEENIERHRIDAVAMEQLTASKYVANVYGFCADSTLVDYSTKENLYKIFDSEIPPTKDELFKIAHDAASAVADVHHFNSDGRATMVHMDIKPSQWIQLDGMYKLNDFNLAQFTSWNQERKQYCGTADGYPGGRVSPVPNENVSSLSCCRESDTCSLLVSYTVASA